MKTKLWAIVFFFLFLFLCVVPSGAQKKNTVDLPDRYKKWLDEEVVYIITPKERDVFLKLQSDREREMFIDAFWKQRNPNPKAPGNEFKEEHYRRIQYANENYGRGSPLPGWKTDRGRIYIVLGPPKNIESYDEVSNVYPTQIWFYLGDPEVGLPTGFNVIFFKKEGMGDYVLYSPTDDGPQSLIAASLGDYQDDQAAYQALRKLEPNLASQVLTLIPGERTAPGALSLASNMLIGHIYSSPQKKVSDNYAEALLKYKDVVEVEYTANYISSDSLVRVLKDDSGFFLVHYSIEPRKLSVEDIGGRYRADFEINGRVADSSGRTIFQYDKEIPLSLTAGQLADLKSQSFELQDIFPLVPGRYRLDLLLKNKSSKEFSSMETEVAVPEPGPAVELSPLTLAYRVETAPGRTREIAPFKVGDLQLLCPARNTFAQRESMAIFFQAYNIPEALRSRAALKFTIFKEDKELKTWTKSLSGLPKGGNFSETLDLKDFAPGYYKISISFLDESGSALASRAENFEISSVPDMPRPFVFGKVMPVSALDEYVFTSGLQLMNKGNPSEAEPLLEKAYRGNPGRPQFALGYGEALYLRKDYAKVIEVLSPFAGKEEATAEALLLVGQAHHALGSFGTAIALYKDYLTRFGANLEVLNSLGACYYQLGQKEEALLAWQKSLELNPKQENIKKLIESIKKS